MLSNVLTRKEQLVLLAVAASVVLGAGALFLHHTWAERPADVEVVAAASDSGTSAPPAAQAPAPAPFPAASPPPEPEPAAVSVRGAVQEPGVYTFEPGARVEDAIERAGGLAEAADLTDINLAARLRDGTTLHIPPRPEPSSPTRRDPWFSALYNPPEYTITGSGRGQAGPAPDAGAGGPAPGADAPSGGLIDLNTASQAALESLPGIGPALAQRIIQHREARPFRSVDDVQHVSGIGPKRLAAIRNLVTVSGG